MSSIALSAVGISELSLILIIGGVFLIIILIAILIWSSGSLDIFLNGVDKKTYEQLAYDSIPKLRKIANLYPSEKVGIQARKFLKVWDSEIEPSLERLDRDKKRKKLRTFYLSDICPILEVYKQMIEP
jgi:hypothetical protein